MDKIRTHKDLKVYLLSFEAGMEIFELSKNFPKEEKYSLTDQACLPQAGQAVISFCFR